MAFIKNILIPIVEISIIGGVGTWILFLIIRPVYRNWKQQMKWFFKYKIMRKKYPETTMAWCIEAIEKGIGYYEIKKMLMIKNSNEDIVYETMYIYDQCLKILNTELQKGGKEKHGREFERSNSKIKDTTNLPNI